MPDFFGESITYPDEMDGGERAIERAVRRAMHEAEITMREPWEAVDTQVHRVVGYGPTKYVATITVEVTNG
jgi:hypothetical protein